MFSALYGHGSPSISTNPTGDGGMHPGKDHALSPKPSPSSS